MEGVKLENRTHAPVDFDTAVASTITSHDAGYINKALEKVVGLQTEAPLKRALIVRWYQNDRRFLQSVQPRTGPDDQKNLH